MNLPVTISIANPDPTATPTTFGQVIALLRQLITGAVTGAYLPYISGSATPAVADQDKLWAKLDGAGRPIGIYKFYSGNWRRFYDHRTNEFVFYSGNPTLDFDTTGLAILGGEWDGFAICNGQNATLDLSDKFIVSGHMNVTDGVQGYAGGIWRAELDAVAQQTGGGTGFVGTGANTYRPAKPALLVSKWKADANAADAGGQMYGDVSTLGTLALIAADPGVPVPARITTLPPFYALAVVQWKGY